MSKRQITFLIVLGVIIAISVIWASYLRVVEGREWAEWTGFGEYKTSTTTIEIQKNVGNLLETETTIVETHQAKTLWDWLVFIFGAFVAIAVAAFNQKNEERRKRTEIRIANDRQQEENLQAYFDRIAKLLLENNLKGPRDNNTMIVRGVAQIFTITALRTLDIERRNRVLQFLRDADLSNFILEKGYLLQHLRQLWRRNTYLTSMNTAQRGDLAENLLQ